MSPTRTKRPPRERFSIVHRDGVTSATSARRAFAISLARSYVVARVPFVHQGRRPLASAGVDCVGAVVVPARIAGATIIDRDDYGRTPKPRELVAAMERNARRLGDDETPRTGDVVLLHARRGEDLFGPMHLAWYCIDGPRPTVIHTNARVGRVVECSFASPYGPEEADSYWTIHGFDD